MVFVSTQREPLSQSDRRSVAVFLSVVAVVGGVVLTTFLTTRGWSTNTWGAVAAIAAGLQAIAVVAALVFTSRQLKEAREAREQRDRPFVLVDFNIAALEKFIHLDIVNHGSTLATNVSFEFDPPLVSAQQALGKVDPKYTPGTMLAKGIPSLVPGTTIRTIFDFSPDRKEARAAGIVLADRFAIVVKYDGPDGRPWRSDYTVDLDYLQHRTYIDRKDIHHAVLELEKIRKILGTTPR